MGTKLEVILTPAEIGGLPRQDLRDATCVVFDVLRATSVFVTALGNGAQSIQPVAEIADALAIKADDPTVLLAGERHGRRILASESGSLDFDLGNSPREFTTLTVANRKIVSTTTNGTRALRACAGAGMVLASSFLNLAATAYYLIKAAPHRIILVCAGTEELLALEDALAAGALCDQLGRTGFAFEAADSARVVIEAFTTVHADLLSAIAGSQNGRRLAAIAELRDDLAFCAQCDTQPIAVVMNAAGLLVRA